MVIRVVPAEWAALNTYAIGDVVDYNGIKFEASAAITGNASNPDPVTIISSTPENATALWRFRGVLRVTDYYSLQYAIQEIINVDDDQINESIPGFIQEAERLMGKVLRSPAQKIRRIFTTTSSRFEIPSDMLEVSHMRRNTQSSSYDLRSRGGIVIQRAADREAFEKLSQYYASTGPFFSDVGQYPYPSYVTDNRYFYIAPDLDDMSEIQLEYYQAVPNLGTTAGRVNADYMPVNANGQTEAQWVAAGNSAGTFVQQEVTVTSNLWTSTQPHILKTAALVEAYKFLKNADQESRWQEQFSLQMQAAQEEFSKFDSGGPSGLQQSTPYC